MGEFVLRSRFYWSLCTHKFIAATLAPLCTAQPCMDDVRRELRALRMSSLKSDARLYKIELNHDALAKDFTCRQALLGALEDQLREDEVLVSMLLIHVVLASS